MSVDLSPHRFEIRAGDRLPALVLRIASDGCCGDGDETFDPDAIVTWTLTAAGPAIITGTPVWDTTAQTLTFAWVAGSTAVAGTYLATVRATDGAGLVRTLPTAGEVEIVVTPLPG